MMEYSFRKLQQDEFHLLIPLMVDCFGMQVDIDYFQWKFVNNPAGFVEGFVAVTPENEIAAYYGVIPELYMIDEQETVIYQSCDTMTHSGHRRKGLFQKLAAHCYENLRQSGKLFVIGFGGGQSTPGFLKFGWRKAFEMKYYFFPRQFSFLHRSFQAPNVKEIGNFSEIESLILKSNRFSAIHSHKTLEVFRWRVSNPRHAYQTIGFQAADGTFSSFLCYYVDAGKIILFDFYFEDKTAGKALTAYLKNQLYANKHKGILAFVQEKSPQSKTLKKHGFISNPFSKGPLSLKVPFIFFTAENKMEKFGRAVNWNIGSFDHDAL